MSKSVRTQYIVATVKKDGKPTITEEFFALTARTSGQWVKAIRELYPDADSIAIYNDDPSVLWYEYICPITGEVVDCRYFHWQFPPMTVAVYGLGYR